MPRFVRSPARSASPMRKRTSPCWRAPGWDAPKKAESAASGWSADLKPAATGCRLPVLPGGASIDSLRHQVGPTAWTKLLNASGFHRPV